MMKSFIRLTACVMLFLAAGINISTAQGVTFTTFPPGISSANRSDNGGFAWGDLNGDGILDLFVPPNNIIINNIEVFRQDLTRVGNIPQTASSTPLMLADFNGDGRLDLFTTNSNSFSAGLYLDSLGLSFRRAIENIGDLASAGNSMNVFCGMTAADIDHSGYLSLVWGGTSTSAPGTWFLKGSATGFINIGRNALSSNVAIDTTLLFEPWDPMFLDANNDNYQDLLMPSFRNGFQRTNRVTMDRARKGTVLFMNDGTGKFFVPTETTLGRPIYSLDSVTTAGVFASTKVDTGIIVDDTVKHFEALANMTADFNNDGNMDIILLSNAANNYDGNGVLRQIVIIYGRGDGTYTYKWNGINIVPANGLPNITIRALDGGDYNNDGFVDVLTCDGTNALFINNGNGTFTNVTTVSNISGMQWRGAGFVDYNADGFLDIYSYTGGTSTLLKNNGNNNNWIGFKPVALGQNTTGIGARFIVYTNSGTKKQIDNISGYAGAQGSGHLWANFGLETATSIDSLVVWWPNGSVQSFNGATLTVNKYWVVEQGSVIPAAPVLSTPADAAVDQTPALELSWAATEGALKYQVQVGLDSTFAKNISINNANVSETSLSIEVGNATTYYWRVRGLNAGFEGQWSAVRSFTTQAGAPSVPALVSPANNAVGQPVPVVLIVNKAAGASMYHWQVSISNEFSTFAINDSTADTVKTSSLTQGTTYFWRVRGVNPGGASDYSDVRSFTVTALASAPTLVFPASDQRSIRQDTLVLTWRSVEGATSYECDISTRSDFATYLRPFVGDRTVIDTTYRILGLSRITKYFWRVRGVNNAGKGAYSVVDSFVTIVPVPTAPGLISPNVAEEVNRLTRFIWRSVLYSEKYQLQVSLINTYATLVVDTTVTGGINDTTCTLKNPLAIETAYFWRVRGIDTAGVGAWSANGSFTTGAQLNTLPSVPTIISPNAVEDVVRLTEFKWRRASNSEKYQLQVSMTNTYATLVVDTTVIGGINDTTCTLTNPLASTTDYFWRVKGFNITNEGGNWSANGSFKTGTIVDVNSLDNIIPKVFALEQNYPNPFNPSTLIQYDLPVSSHVKLAIYDMLGREVAKLVDGVQPANRYNVQWNATNLSSGVYFYRIDAKGQDGKNFTSVKKLILMK